MYHGSRMFLNVTVCVMCMKPVQLKYRCNWCNWCILKARDGRLSNPICAISHCYEYVYLVLYLQCHDALVCALCSKRGVKI